jgi:hypothetical protein
VPAAGVAPPGAASPPAGTAGPGLVAGPGMVARTRAAAGGRWRGDGTPGQLRRLLLVILAATVLLWLVATIVAQGLHGTAAAVRAQDAPAFTDATEAHAVLSDADRAAWQSFRSGEAQLTGPGQQYQNDITTAGQDLERLAALAPPGTVSQQLQTISGQLVNYQGLVEQADAASRADIALGNASGHDLGYAYLSYSSSAMRNPQGGLLASVSGVTGTDRQALDQGLASWWASPVLLLLVLAAAGWLLWSIIRAQRFLLRRFRRMTSPPLVLAGVLTVVLVAWVATTVLSAESALGAARGTALPALTRVWLAQASAVNAQAAALRAGKSASGSGGLSVIATQQASRALTADLTSAQDAGGLPAGIPVLAVAIAGLAGLGFKFRLDEYRG